MMYTFRRAQVMSRRTRDTPQAVAVFVARVCSFSDRNRVCVSCLEATMVVSDSGVPTGGVCQILHCIRFQFTTTHKWRLSQVRTRDLRHGLARARYGKFHPLTFCDVIIAVTRLVSFCLLLPVVGL